VNHHVDSLVGIEISLAVETGQTKEGLLCIFNSALSDQPPRALGSEGNSNDERNGPHPLQGVRNTVCPLVVTVQQGLHDSDTNSLAHAPAEVDVCSEISTESDGANFGGVGYSESLEDTPWDTGVGVSYVCFCINDESAYPQRISATKRVWTFCAVKKTAVTAAIMTRQVMTV